MRVRPVRHDTIVTCAVMRALARRQPMSAWYVYLIECRGGSIYTGIATDVARRYAEHVAGKGARYTRAWPPERLLGSFAHQDRSSASKAEFAVKQLSAARKRALCAVVDTTPAT